MPKNWKMTIHWVEHALTLAHRMAEARSDLDRHPCAARANEWAHRVKELRAHLKTEKHDLPPQQCQEHSSLV